MIKRMKARAFRAIGDWLIRRAQRTPYSHLYHKGNQLYMERFWLLRLGLPSNYQELQRQVERHERRLEDPYVSEEARARLRDMIADLRQEMYPRLGIRVHHIASGDEPVFHDHPWNFWAWILRGGYKEVTPLTPDGVTGFSRPYEAGSFRRVRATQWHYLRLEPGQEAWSLFITFRRRQNWGFLVNGEKVPWQKYRGRQIDIQKAPKV